MKPATKPNPNPRNPEMRKRESRIRMFILLIIPFVAGHLFKNDSQVLQLDGQQLQELISFGKPLFLMLYAPWCGHCKNMIPAYDTFADQVDISVVAINWYAKRLCIDHSDVKTRFSVKGFPTLLYIQNGQVFKYQGLRSSDALKDFINSPELKDGQPIPEYVVRRFKFLPAYLDNLYVIGGVGLVLFSIVFIGCLCIQDRKQRIQLAELQEKLNEQKKDQ